MGVGGWIGYGDGRVDSVDGLSVTRISFHGVGWRLGSGGLRLGVILLLRSELHRNRCRQGICGCGLFAGRDAINMFERRYHFEPETTNTAIPVAKVRAAHVSWP